MLSQRRFTALFIPLWAALCSTSMAFTATTPPRIATTTTLHGATTTMEPPTKQRTETGYTQEELSQDDTEYPDLEYLIDSMESREMEDPFHILLLGSTFDKPKVTVSYVTGSLEYVLDMPGTEAKELSQFSKVQGMACLGTWPREESLSLGQQLQRRDIVCRVVPFVEGGQRGWQAKDASNQGSRTYSTGG